MTEIRAGSWDAKCSSTAEKGSLLPLESPSYSVDDAWENCGHD